MSRKTWAAKTFAEAIASCAPPITHWRSNTLDSQMQRVAYQPNSIAFASRQSHRETSILPLNKQFPDYANLPASLSALSTDAFPQFLQAHNAKLCPTRSARLRMDFAYSYYSNTSWTTSQKPMRRSTHSVLDHELCHVNTQGASRRTSLLTQGLASPLSPRTFRR